MDTTEIQCGVGPLGYVVCAGRSPAADGVGAVMTLTPEKLKAQFRNEGQTFSEWARQRGYRPQQVLRVLNGFDKGHRGKAHEIAVELGMKSGTASA